MDENGTIKLPDGEVTKGEESSVRVPTWQELRELALKNKGIKYDLVFIEEWGFDIAVKTMTGKQRAKQLQKQYDLGGKVSIEEGYADAVIDCACHPITHEPLFTAADKEEVLGFGLPIIEKIGGAAFEVSGMTTKAVNELRKNSNDPKST